MSNRVTRTFMTRPWTVTKARRHALAHGRRRVSAAPLPFVAQHFAEPAVFPLAFTEALFAPDADGPVAATFEGFAAGDVLGVDLGHEVVEIELAERVSRTYLHRLGRVALSPAVHLADDDAGHRVGVQPVDAVDPGGADGFPLRIDHPPHVVLGLADLLEELLLLIERDGHAVVEIASDLHVREPAHEVPGVLLPARTECHVRALQKRSEHRSGQNSRTSTFSWIGSQTSRSAGAPETQAFPRPCSSCTAIPRPSTRSSRRFADLASTRRSRAGASG